MKEIYRVSQLSSQGEFIYDFGFFDSKEKAYNELRKGFKDLYKDIDFDKDVCFDNRSQYVCNKYEFIIDISAIDFNRFYIYGGVRWEK